MGGAVASCSCDWPSVAGDRAVVSGGDGSARLSDASADAVWAAFLQVQVNTSVRVLTLRS